jgi:hypothetical protein
MGTCSSLTPDLAIKQLLNMQACARVRYDHQLRSQESYSVEPRAYVLHAPDSTARKRWRNCPEL